MRRGLGRHNYRSAGGVAPFDPNSLGNVFASFKKGDFVQSAGFISQWNDSSGNARHLTQGTGLNQPSAPGDGTALFDGISQFLANSSFVVSQPFTVCIREKPITWTLNTRTLAFQAPASMFILDTGSSPTVGLGSLSNVTTNDVAVGSYNSIVAVVNNASSSIQANAGAASTGAIGTANASQTMVVASNTIAGGNFKNMQAAEIWVFSAALTAPQIAQMIAYLNTK